LGDMKQPEASVQFELFDAAIEPLLDYRRELVGSLKKKEIRKLMRAKAEELGFEFSRKPLMLGNQKYPSDWVLDYVEMRVGGRTDFEVADVLGGHHWFAKIPIAGCELPFMLTITSPFTDIEKFHEKVRYAFRKEFGPLMSLRPKSVDEGVGLFLKRVEKMQYKDIADESLEEKGAFEKIEADSDAERERIYVKKVLPKETNRLRRLFKRFADSVTEVAGLESRE
jgi:hypothetical protein